MCSWGRCFMQFCSPCGPSWRTSGIFWGAFGFILGSQKQQKIKKATTRPALGPPEASGRLPATIFGRFGTIFGWFLASQELFCISFGWLPGTIFDVFWLAKIWIAWLFATHHSLGTLEVSLAAARFSKEELINSFEFSIRFSLSGNFDTSFTLQRILGGASRRGLGGRSPPRK